MVMDISHYDIVVEDCDDKLVINIDDNDFNVTITAEH
jgi:hypothetical protein